MAVVLEIKPNSGTRTRVFTIISLAILIASYQIYKLLGGSGGLFAKQTTLTTYMPDVTGLVPGADGSDVRLNGITIGNVDKIQISSSRDPQRAVRVDLKVQTSFLKAIPSDSQTDISADTLIGNQFVAIDQGKSPIPVREGAVLASVPQKDQTLVSANLMQTLQADLAQVDQLLKQITSPDTELGRQIVGEDIYDSVLKRLDGFDHAIHTFLTPQSSLGKAFYSMQAYDDIHGKVLEVDKTLEDIQKGEGTAGRLLTSPDQYNNLVAQLTSLRSALAEANSGKGKFAGLLHDETAYRNIQKMLRSTDETLASLNAGEGAAGRLLTSAQLYESLSGSLHSMEELLRDVRQNPQKYLRVKIR